MIKVEVLKKANKQDLADINILIPQLTLSAQSPPLLNQRSLKQLLSQSGAYCAVVRTRGGARRGIVALGTIHLNLLPSGLAAETGDLVVDKRFRGVGLGRVILEKLIDLAEEKGVRHISLRVNPKRKEAIGMYAALGFERRPAAFFRINLPRRKK